MTDVFALLQRDHEQLERSLAVMMDPGVADDRMWEAFEEVQLGLAAHAQAEERTLHRVSHHVQALPAMSFLVAQILSSHRAQAVALEELARTPRGTSAWHERASRLRMLIHQHAAHERHVIPALRDFVPSAVYDSLAGCYATARLRALGTIPPVIASAESNAA